MSSASIWMISLASIALMLMRPRGIAEWVWVSGGALLLLGTRLLPLGGAAAAIYESADVCMFLVGMMLLSEVAREEGVFDWLAEVAVGHAGGSASRLFAWVYCVGIAVTALLSNDATAVVLTPAVLAVARRAKVKALPHLMACAMVANAASFLLPISNPANLVVFGAHLPPLGQWLRFLLAPSVVAIGATFVCLRVLFRRTLAEEAATAGRGTGLATNGRLALGGILATAAVLLVCSGFGVALGGPTLAASMVALALVAVRDRQAPRRALSRISWGVVPLVAGLFMIVAALDRAGLVGLVQAGVKTLAADRHGMGRAGAAAATAIAANIMNNLPVGLAAGTALRQAGHTGLLAHAVLIGVDVGPNLSVTGSLATILWLIALRREGEEVSAWRFLQAGAVAMPAALLLAVLALR
jgi:arsenical pump membrane protein